MPILLQEAAEFLPPFIRLKTDTLSVIFIKLKNLGKIQTGNTPSRNQYDLYYSTEKGIPWIKAENLGDASPIVYTQEFLTDEGRKESRVFPENTVYGIEEPILKKHFIELAIVQEEKERIENKGGNNIDKAG